MKEKVSVFTLGCKTNLYESRQLVAGLKNAGYRACEGLEKADIYIINTCAVTNEAERKSRQAISRCKKLNPDAKILVCGCAAQHDGGQFSENVNFVAGTADKLRLIEQLNSTGCPARRAADGVPKGGNICRALQNARFYQDSGRLRQFLFLLYCSLSSRQEPQPLNRRRDGGGGKQRRKGNSFDGSGHKLLRQKYGDEPCRALPRP